LEETEQALNYIKSKNVPVALMHCVSKYPCPPEDANLATLDFYQDKFSIPVGFSDHSLSIEPAMVAVALGAKLIEKHFSLSRDLWGSDHKVSLLQGEMTELVRNIREMESNPAKKNEIAGGDMEKKYMGVKGKILQDGEAVFRPLFRKSLMAGMDMKAGEILTQEKIYAMRPQAYAGGLPSEKYPEVLGKKIKKDLRKYDPIIWEILEQTQN
jgi:sialic acid synthase SpsE